MVGSLRSPSMGPGEMMFAVMPVGPNSMASALVRPCTAVLLTPYAACGAPGASASEATASEGQYLWQLRPQRDAVEDVGLQLAAGYASAGMFERLGRPDHKMRGWHRGLGTRGWEPGGAAHSRRRRR